MSGHSKWSTIKRKKGAEDAKRSKLFTRITREIVTAVREGGGPEIENNPRLRLAVDKAKGANMPKDNIQRAINKGAGIGDDGIIYQEIVYEGYGPNGIAVLVEVTTDNKNRSLAEIKNAFNKGGGQLASEGSVQWQFDQKGFIQLAGTGIDFDEAFLVAADAGAEDVVDEDGTINIYTPREQLFKVAQSLIDNGYQIAESELTWIPQNEVELAADDTVQVLKLLERLEELADVDAVSSNLSLSADAIAAFESA